MDLGIKFPTEDEVVRQDASRFRALSADAQRRSIDDMFRLSQFLLRNCDHPEVARRLIDEQEVLNRSAIEAAVALYAR